MKNFLISLLIGIALLIITMPSYALTPEEAEKYVGETVLVIGDYPSFKGAMGMVLSIDKLENDIGTTLTFLTVVGYDKRVYLFEVTTISKIQKVDLFGFLVEE